MRRRSHAALAALLLLLLTAAPALGTPPRKIHRPAVVNGRAVTEVVHVDDPRWGLDAERFARSFQGQAPVDGPLTDPVQRGGARMLAGAAPDGAAATTIPPATTWCGVARTTDDVADERTNLPRYKVIYAYPSGATNRMTSYQDLIQKSPTWVANKIAESAGGLRAPRFDYGTSCGPQYVDITQVALAHTKAQYDAISDALARADTVRNDVTAALPGMQLSPGKWNYLVFADGVSPPSDPRSVGYMYNDDRAGAANANESGGNMAIVLGSGGTSFVGAGSEDYLAYSVTHEVGHTLGAVQLTAPHSTGAGHCTNGYAIMCYADGGTKGTYTTSACPTGSQAGYATVVFQCGGDDYVSSAPALGSYLASHWNMYDSSFMCDVDACLASAYAPIAALTASATRVPAGTTVTLDASGSSDRGGSITAYDWDLDGNGTYERSTATTPSTTLDLPQQGSRRVTLRVTNDSGLTATAAITITVDGRAPVAVLSVPPAAAVGQTVMLDGSGSSDPDGDRLSYAWDYGTGTFTPSAASIVTFTPAQAGNVAIRVRVTDTTGASSIAAATLTVSAPSAFMPAAVAPAAGPGSPLAKTLAAKVVRVRHTKAGTTLVLLECPRTSPGCRGRATVSVGRRARTMAYALASGTRRTLAIRPPVKLRRGHAKAARLRVADESGATVSKPIRLSRV